MAFLTYYFDESVEAPNDPDNKWSNESNAFDGSTSSFSNYTTGTAGSTSSNYLEGKGTNAPSSGGTITRVKARVYGLSTNAPSIHASIATENRDEVLGEPSIASSSPAWSSYVTLTEPTGGWTWDVIQKLEVRLFEDVAFRTYVQAYKVEIEVETELNYYFDASDSGPATIGDGWALNTNAFDGDTATFAYTINGGISGVGTNAPSSGDSIEEVNVRMNVYTPPVSGWGIDFDFLYDSSSLGAIPVGDGVSGWVGYTTLSTPSGGWTWAKVQALEAIAIGTVPGGPPLPDTYNRLYKMEIEVVTSVGETLSTDQILFEFSIGDDHTILSNDASLTLASENTTIGQNSVIFPADILVGLSEEAAALSQAHDLALEDIQVLVSEEGTSLSQNHIMASADILVSLLEEATTISQIHSLQLQDVQVGVSFDDSSISLNYTLDINGVSVSLSIDNANITGVGVDLLPQDMGIVLTIDNTETSQDHSIVSQDVLVSLSIDFAVFSALVDIYPLDVLVGLLVNNMSLSGNHVIPPSDIAVSPSMDNSTINQNHVLVAQEVEVSLSEDTTSVDQTDIVLSSSDISLFLSEESVTVNQNYVFIPNDVVVGTLLDSTNLSYNTVLEVGDIVVSLSEDNTLITELYVLSPADVLTTVALDNASIALIEIILKNRPKIKGISSSSKIIRIDNVFSVKIKEAGATPQASPVQSSKPSLKNHSIKPKLKG